MTIHQVGTLITLVDQIREKIDVGELEYRFAKDSLEKILEGPRLPPTTTQNGLLLKQTFSVASCPGGELESVKNKYGRRTFKGYEETSLNIGPFFTQWPMLETSGGEAGVFIPTRRMTAMEFIQELLELGEEPIEAVRRKIIDNCLSFSIRQVVEILKNRNIERPKRGSIVFLVHDANLTDVAIAVFSSSHKGLLGKDDDSPYLYSPNSVFVVRTVPPRFLLK